MEAKLFWRKAYGFTNLFLSQNKYRFHNFIHGLKPIAIERNNREREKRETSSPLFDQLILTYLTKLFLWISFATPRSSKKES